MLIVGSTTWQQRRGLWKGEGGEKCRQRLEATARGDGVGRRRREEVPGGGASEADLLRDGELQQGWRRNRSAAAESCGGGAGRKWRARARGEILAIVYSRASAEMPRAAVDASYLVPRIVQTAARPIKFATPPRIPCLLEGRFHLRAWYTGGFFSACAL
jgi:hypothetical protein